MFVFHIGHSRYASDLTGKGAELHGGRWNEAGLPCIYAASSRSLGILEYAANVKLEYLPASLAMTTYEIPDNCWRTISLQELPANWQERPFPTETVAFGSDLLRKREHLAFRIPSVIVPAEHNFILNPLHLDFNQVKIAGIEPLEFDTRIKQ
ncbi:RES domain-containing protein [Anseongella ginsenosidimutans]|uniref:RES domain-containing protein n=1 Tax=Anseongella ginsenosidimutans TaxID=496056 RepID=A0A4R3KSK4_9SPHI|nr:RES family NAD+ phosphorylase [Anseongella ginsenosidimutans]QEC52170.1 RES domain-containing protein [Anseongella ginsenosidimutans]TCS86711.1 RES domain-containing protein [Anseongella ginsenosidimutans]